MPVRDRALAATSNFIGTRSEALDLSRMNRSEGFYCARRDHLRASDGTKPGRIALAALFGTVFLTALIVGEPSFASPFDVSPRGYAAPVNQVLRQVGSGIRFSLRTCRTDAAVECTFAAGRVTAVVQGSVRPPHVGKVVIKGDLLQDQPGADPFSVVTDVVLAFGATMVTFDPQVPTDQRVQMLSDLTENAINTGES